MSISFNTIPSGIRVPLFYAEMDNSAAYTPTNTSQSLLIGQKLESGTAEEGVPVTVSTVAMAKKLFGRGSMLARMVDVYRTVDSFGQLVCIPLADGQSAGAAAGKVEITGTALEAGTLSFYIGGERLQVAVKEGDTGAQIAIALSDSISLSKDLPVTAGVPLTESARLQHERRVRSEMAFSLHSTFVVSSMARRHLPALA